MLLAHGAKCTEAYIKKLMRYNRLISDHDVSSLLAYMACPCTNTAKSVGRYIPLPRIIITELHIDYCDMVIKLKDEQTIDAHSFMFYANCVYFRTMVSSGRFSVLENGKVVLIAQNHSREVECFDVFRTFIG
jgi:BTB/POZ domain